MSADRIVMVRLGWYEALGIRELVDLVVRDDVEGAARALVNRRCTHHYVMPHIFCPACRTDKVRKDAVKYVHTALRGINRIKAAMLEGSNV